MAKAPLPGRTAQKIGTAAASKAPLTVTWQNPPAGAPVTAGMIVEVRAASTSDVSYDHVDAGVPAAVGKASVADVVDIIESDPKIGTWVEKGTLLPDEGRAAADALHVAFQKKGIAFNPTPSDAKTIIESFGQNFRG